MMALLRAIGLELTGRLHFSSAHVGSTLDIDGESWTVIREVLVDDAGAPDPAAVIYGRFGTVGANSLTKFALLVLAIPLLCGVKGFRGKQWLRNSRGEYLGISCWRTSQDAESYLASDAVRYLERNCKPGSLRIQMLESIGLV